jgi:hypothetical protein
MFIATSLSRNANNLHESAVPRNGHDGKADHEIRQAMGDKFTGCIPLSSAKQN